MTSPTTGSSSFSPRLDNDAPNETKRKRGFLTCSYRDRVNSSVAPRAIAVALLFVFALSALADIVAGQSAYIGEYDGPGASRSRTRARSNRPARSKYTRYRGGTGQRYRGLRRLLDDDDDSTSDAEIDSARNLRVDDASTGADVASGPETPASATCPTLLQIIENHPNMTRLTEAMSDLPVARLRVTFALLSERPWLGSAPLGPRDP